MQPQPPAPDHLTIWQKEQRTSLIKHLVWRDWNVLKTSREIGVSRGLIGRLMAELSIVSPKHEAKKIRAAKNYDPDRAGRL